MKYCCPTPALAGVSPPWAITVYQCLSQAALKPAASPAQSNGAKAFDLEVVLLRQRHGAK